MVCSVIGRYVCGFLGLVFGCVSAYFKIIAVILFFY